MKIMGNNNPLQEIRNVFTTKNTDRLTTAEIIEALQPAQPDLTARSLAKLLREHNIKPKNIRSGNTVAKGYRLEDLDVADVAATPSATEVTDVADKPSATEESATPRRLKIAATQESATPVPATETKPTAGTWAAAVTWAMTKDQPTPPGPHPFVAGKEEFYCKQCTKHYGHVAHVETWDTTGTYQVRKSTDQV